MTQTTMFDPNPAASFAAVQRYIDEIAPENLAPIPFAMSSEIDDIDGTRKWFTYLTVNTPDLGEHDVVGRHVELEHSISTALTNLKASVSPARRTNLTIRRVA